MKRIASFQIDHDVLTPGMYTSRVDGDVVTYDLRFVRPNTPPYLENAGMHTLEHLFATYVRNSAFEENILYFGPMGCRTGFYFLTRGMTHAQAIALTGEALNFVASYEGVIPGTSKAECGNYLEHDLEQAREYAARLASILENWTVERLVYPSK
jgi:S-ribosylhomocysteine lyase